MSEEKEFVWTDALVLEFANYTNHTSPTFQGRYSDLKQFKEGFSRKPLFKTNDGVEVFPNDSFYAVSDDWKIFFSNATSEKIDYAGRTFSKKELAVEHIIMNKPCLSISDFEKCIKAHLLPDDMKTFYFKPMRELVKQKIQ